MSWRFSRSSFLLAWVVVLPPVGPSLVSRSIWRIQRGVFRGKYESKLLFRDAPKIQFSEAMTGKHRRRPISDRKCPWKAEEWGQKNPNRAILLLPFFCLLGHGRGNIRKWIAETVMTEEGIIGMVGDENELGRWQTQSVGLDHRKGEDGVVPEMSIKLWHPVFRSDSKIRLDSGPISDFLPPTSDRERKTRQNQIKRKKGRNASSR